MKMLFKNIKIWLVSLLFLVYMQNVFAAHQENDVESEETAHNNNQSSASSKPLRELIDNYKKENGIESDDIVNHHKKSSMVVNNDAQSTQAVNNNQPQQQAVMNNVPNQNNNQQQVDGDNVEDYSSSSSSEATDDESSYEERKRRIKNSKLFMDKYYSSKLMTVLQLGMLYVYLFLICYVIYPTIFKFLKKLDDFFGFTPAHYKFESEEDEAIIVQWYSMKQQIFKISSALMCMYIVCCLRKDMRYKVYYNPLGKHHVLEDRYITI